MFTCNFSWFRRKNVSFLLLIFLSIILYTTVVEINFADESSGLSVKIKENSYLTNLTNKIIQYAYGTVDDEFNITTLKKQITKFLREDGACRIPKLDPLPDSIKDLVHDQTTGNCDARNYTLLFESTLDFQLVPLKSRSEMDNRLGIKSCCYKLITRSPGITHDDNHLLSAKCFPVSLEGPTNVSTEHEFVAIFCDYHPGFGVNTTSKLVDAHAFVPIKQSVEDRISRMNTKTGEESVNVVIFGLDSLSHMNFLRSMPKSYSYLMEKLDAVEIHGYNSVGSGTYQNLLAALTSYDDEEIKRDICDIQTSFNNCPFIWKEFAEAGFRTVYGEDAVKNRTDGLSDGNFNYALQGFQTPPTDYYLRAFGMVAENIREYFEDLCYGPRLALQVLLNYMQKLAYTMGRDKRYFQLLWSTKNSHGGLNDGRLGDKHLLSTLEWFQKGGYLNQTIFILMSGLRWGGIMNTTQGPLELRMPLLYFVMPPWFKAKFPRAIQNLRENVDKLTTPRDLHQTLADLTTLKKMSNDKIYAREKKLLLQKPLPRGISLFLPIPLSRTCQTAHILNHYCVCRTLKKISTNFDVVKEAATFAVRFINSILSKYPQCAKLNLTSISQANTVTGLQTEKYQEVYQIFFETAPSNATFEATVLLDKRKGIWSVSGTIDRTNLYGSQSHCVHDKQAKLYCYCNNGQSKRKLRAA